MVDEHSSIRHSALSPRQYGWHVSRRPALTLRPFHGSPRYLLDSTPELIAEIALAAERLGLQFAERHAHRVVKKFFLSRVIKQHA
jgi:hypothetical protein